MGAMNVFSRTQMLLGAEGMERLRRARVAVFGLGGVGGWAVEALARSGIGALDLVDHDRIEPTNLNRQVFASTRNISAYKTEAARRRVLAINPAAAVRVYPLFYGPDTAGALDFREYDYILDAVDTVTAKLLIAQEATKASVPLISAMGTGNKLDASALEVADIYETSVCPLARIMRKELRKRGIPRLKVVYSREPPIVPEHAAEGEEPISGGGKRSPGSAVFVPAAAGMIMAGEAVRELCGFSAEGTSRSGAVGR